jgi:two-component system, NtrC family, response regulator HydG
MPREPVRIGLVEDDPVMGGSIVQRIELEGGTISWWKSGQQAIEAIAAEGGSFDLVICDIRLPDITGEEVFRALAGQPDTPPFIFVTGFGDIDQAVRLMRAGAADFMTKPFLMDDFLKRIETHRRAMSPGTGGGKPGYILGVSAPIRDAEDLLRRYAGHDLPVFITGETGSGKEVAARLLHGLSQRATAPFMAVNCAAIPADLLESEIFGHERGAFTGAQQRHLGYAERAGGGTLFLDEIGDMPPALQAKLLRLIESGSFFRLGGEKPVPFRARIVAATHRKSTAGGGDAAIREDLYYRLAVLPVEIPPLRERSHDIAWLMDRCLADASARMASRIRGFSALAEEAALGHAWPGNVRELRNRVERAAAIGAGEWIMPGDLFPERGIKRSASGFVPLADVRDAAERRQIERALDETDGQIAKAAGLLSISRTTLWEKMTRFGLAERQRSES